MKHLARLSCLAAALCLGIPATGFSNDHGSPHGGSSSGHGNWNGNHGNWNGGVHISHGGNYYGGGYPYCPPFPYFAPYRYYGTSFYSAPAYYNTGYYDSPSFGISISPSTTYRGTRVDDRADSLTIDVQRALRRDGYYRGSIDGDIGPGTRGAIRQYQYDHRLEVTGRIDRSLLRALALD
ncbi:MAG: peptidoglycan-binding protein [Chthoniobacter sp.]|uniref:peptidoglycan-binding domain-containing protein n=1 Tax=Chthoniobacter sp. TaxID=2510640 RepID=UPI0032A715B3